MQNAGFLQKPLNRDLLFYVILIASMITIGWDNILFKSQSELHLWRQSDCISIADYYSKGNGFFEPEMHSQISDDRESGKTVAEFPIIYYIVGKIWSVTGMQLWIFRLLTALTSILAMVVLYKTVYRITQSWYWSVIAPLILLISPLYAFYGIGFLTNVPALNFVIIGWCVFYSYYESGKLKYLLWTMALFSLGGLLKVSSMTSHVVLMILFGLEFMGLASFGKGQKLFSKKLLSGAILLIPVVINLLWYRGFVEWYCTLHSGRYSFTEPKPFWGYSHDDTVNIVRIFFSETLGMIYAPHIWLTLGGMMILLLAKFRQVNKIFLAATILIFLGHSAFSLLFFFCLDRHDYYHADILVWSVFVYVAFAKYLTSNEQSFSQHNLTRVFVAVSVIWALMGSSSINYIKFNGCPPSETPYRELFCNRSLMNTIIGFNDGMKRMSLYRNVGEELTKRGFPKSVKVFSSNDNSFNSTLVLCDHPGFTNLVNAFSDSAYAAEYIRHGAQLMFVENAQFETRGVKAFMKYKLFEVEHISVYDLRPYASQLK